MCFDTERVNSGHLSGTAVQMESKLGQGLLYLPCRHHMLELVSSAFFFVTVENSTKSESPHIPLFENFRNEYFNNPQFKKSECAPCTIDNYFQNYLIDENRDELIEFCNHQLTIKQKHTRSDHIEMLKLTVIMLSEPNEAQNQAINIYKPGPYNRARFLCRLLYTSKIYLYRSQLNLDQGLLNAIRAMLLFYFKVYLKNWFTATDATSAPRKDLQLLKELKAFEDICGKAEAAFSKWTNHLWYLGEKVVALALFDPEVSIQMKIKMIERLERPSTQKNPNKYSIDEEENVVSLDLSHFVTKKTKKFFEILNLDPSFLSEDPNNWIENQHYINACARVRMLTVVNDAAERSIALYKDYKEKVKSSENMHDLLQVVESNRKEYGKRTRKEILSKLTGNE